ncbi:MAG: hypothetical protein QNJ97_25915 [Myxococcota bacterium]|nr:hypothetical protein [Myxococcota bacterium]
MRLSFSPDEDKAVGPGFLLEAHKRRIAGYLTVLMPEPVDVIFTNNRSTMVSFKRRGGRLIIRMHRLFRHADPEILDALALYIGKREKSASQKLDQFIVRYQHEIHSPAKTRQTRVTSAGQHHDLSAVLNKVSGTYFGGKVDVRIGWGRSPTCRRRRRTRSVSRALATYSFDDSTIRVSPILDAADVPGFVVEWVVYHEVLHHVLPVEEIGGKRRYHTEQFRSLERAFVHYDAAKAWEKQHLNRLLA